MDLIGRVLDVELKLEVDRHVFVQGQSATVGADCMVVQAVAQQLLLVWLGWQNQRQLMGKQPLANE